MIDALILGAVKALDDEAGRLDDGRGRRDGGSGRGRMVRPSSTRRSGLSTATSQTSSHDKVKMAGISKGRDLVRGSQDRGLMID